MGRSAGARGAGTLSYMAPEHLDSIHAPSTEKSDVYSFAIVVWVILTGNEPYESELALTDVLISMKVVIFMRAMGPGHVHWLTVQKRKSS